jgi:hypothetical protein
MLACSIDHTSPTNRSAPVVGASALQPAGTKCVGSRSIHEGMTYQREKGRLTMGDDKDEGARMTERNKLADQLAKETGSQKRRLQTSSKCLVRIAIRCSAKRA